MNDYAPLLAALLALLAGLDDRQGVGALQAARRQVDRSAPRARVAALHPRPELPRRQPDRSRDRRAEPRREPRRRCARSAHDPRQPVPGEGTGRQGDHRAPGAAAALEAEPAGARLRAALPRASTTSAAASSIARSKRSTRCCGSIRRTSTRCVNLQKLHEEQHQWTEAYDTRQRLTKLAAIDSRPQSQAILAFLENEIGLEAMRRKDYRRGDAALPGGDRSRRARGAGLPEPGRRPRGARATRRRRPRSGRSSSQVAPDRAYLAFDRLEALRRPDRAPRALHAPLPPADRREPAGLARAARAVAPSGRRAASRTRRSTCCSPRSCRIRTRSASTRRSGARSGSSSHPAGARRPLRRADAARRLLPRSARLHALPLPQHRAALAVPALPRLEHVRRRADRAGAGRDGSRSLEGVFRCRLTSASSCRQIASTCASVSSNVPSVVITKSARAAFSSAGICAASRWRASVSVKPRAASRASCVAGEQTVAIDAVEIASARPVSYSSGMSTTASGRRRSARTRAARRRSRGRPPGARSPRDRGARPSSANTIGAELLPIDGAVGVEHVRAEPRGDRVRRLGSRAGHAVRELVGVETRHAAAAGSARARSSCRWRCRRSVRLSALRQPVGGASRSSHADRRRSAARQRVLEQHRDRQRSDAARHRRQRAGDLPRPPDGRRRRTSAPRRSNASRRFEPAGTAARPIARSLDRVVPTSTTVAPGLTKSGVTNAGRPSAATRMSASRATRGRSAVREWQMVTVAWRCSSSSAIGLPTMSLRPMTTARAPAIGMLDRSSSSITPDGVHATSAARFCTRRPTLTG